MVSNNDGWLNTNHINALRIIMHNEVYSKDGVIDTLIYNLSKNCNFIANYNYDSDRRSIEIKVRKSNLKKDSSYIHNTEYYYGLINDGFVDFISSHEVKGMLYDYIKSNEDIKETYESLINKSIPANLMYNMTSILDNIIFIYL